MNRVGIFPSKVERIRRRNFRSRRSCANNDLTSCRTGSSPSYHTTILKGPLTAFKFLNQCFFKKNIQCMFESKLGYTRAMIRIGLEQYAKASFVDHVEQTSKEERGTDVDIPISSTDDCLSLESRNRMTKKKTLMDYSIVCHGPYSSQSVAAREQTARIIVEEIYRTPDFFVGLANGLRQGGSFRLEAGSKEEDVTRKLQHLVSSLSPQPRITYNTVERLAHTLFLTRCTVGGIPHDGEFRRTSEQAHDSASSIALLHMECYPQLYTVSLPFFTPLDTFQEKFTTGVPFLTYPSTKVSYLRRSQIITIYRTERCMDASNCVSIEEALQWTTRDYAFWGRLLGDIVYQCQNEGKSFSTALARFIFHPTTVQALQGMATITYETNLYGAERYIVYCILILPINKTFEHTSTAHLRERDGRNEAARITLKTLGRFPCIYGLQTERERERNLSSGDRLRGV